MNALLRVVPTAWAVLVGIPSFYLFLLAAAAVRRPHTPRNTRARHRFAIAIPAHNEAAVIGNTVSTLRALDYPSDLFDVHVVADHCSDRTAQVARTAGAFGHERNDGPRGSKGAALRWLFERILADGAEVRPYDAVVVFDADTRVAPDFLRVIDARLATGSQVVQGQHVIRNPEDGWFPALTWAMFLVDNRIQNLGRVNLGWSAKNMGDSICFRADVLRRLGWGEGLTEDYAFRQRLLLDGIRIDYEPAALGYGEAPATWAAARVQRARWLRGTRDATQAYGRSLLREALRRRSLPLIDGALQTILPSYSTLTLLAAIGWIGAMVAYLVRRDSRASLLGWTAGVVALAIYPLFGLALERAPLKAYLVILTGPLFIAWRSWLAVVSRFGRRNVVWVRTARRAESQPAAESA